jgi:solute carrier family 25 phosphate transporter 23/24/25/41
MMGMEYKGIFYGLRKIVADEGWLGFFKGNGTNVLRIAPYSAVQFYSFETSKRELTNAPSLKALDPAWVSLAAGGISGISASVSTYPLDLIRTRLTIQTTQGEARKYLGLVHTFKTVVREEGVLALYKGVGTTCLGIFPYSAINFAVYDSLKRWLVDPKKPIGVVESLMYGGIAGATAQTFTYPVDLLRRRMQLQGIGGNPRLYSGPIDAVKKIVAADGIGGLYKGMVACYLKVVPSIAISFCTYEVMRLLLGVEKKTNFGAG